MSFSIHRPLVLVLALLAAAAAQAQIQVHDAWVRASVPQQKATGAFMRLQSAQGARLVGVSSPVAPLAEVHEMAVQDGVMRMRAVPALALPAGQVVELKPGGYHVMLMDLPQPLQEGQQVPLTLQFEHADGRRESLQLQAEVRALGARAGQHKGHGGHHGHGKH